MSQIDEIKHFIRSTSLKMKMVHARIRHRAAPKGLGEQHSVVQTSISSTTIVPSKTS